MNNYEFSSGSVASNSEVSPLQSFSSGYSVQGRCPICGEECNMGGDFGDPPIDFSKHCAPIPLGTLTTIGKQQ